MSERIIIENQSTLPMEEALTYVAAVIRQGRISEEGKNYCYVTSFKAGVVVSAIRNKKSDRFIIQNTRQDA